MPVRVLLLDDDLVFASEARTAFLAAGCEVEVLDDGSAAVLRASQQPPDVVIASAELPGINGFRLCTRLKKAHEGLAVVLTFADVSASGVSSHQKLVSHADAYVPRTVAIHELVTRVRSLVKRARSETPASSRRRTGAPSSAPRSRTPAKGTPAARSVRPSPGTTRAVLSSPLHPPMAPPPVLGRAGLGAGVGAPRPELGGSGQAERDKLRKDLDAAKSERDELSRALQASRTDAEALRRALDQARAEIVKVQSEATSKARAATAADAEAGVLGAALAEASRERDERASELEVSRARITRLEQQLAEAPPPSERFDQRLAVMQRAADSARLEREEARREADAQRARAVELDGQLRKEQLARAEAEAKRELAIEHAELGMADPSTVEGRVQAAMDLARREHALEMTRLRGEHAAVVFQLRHELAVLRGTSARASIVSVGHTPLGKPTPSQGTPALGGSALAGDVSERAHTEAVVALKERHAKELEATRANLGVMMRRVEALEAQLGEVSASGERPVAPRPAPPPVPARNTR